MPSRVVVLGAGFGGLDLTTMLSEAFGEGIDVVLIDKGESFVFGFSKLTVMFGRRAPQDVRHAYRDFVKSGVRFVQSTVRSIDPTAKRVVTDDGAFEADFLVVALGADLDPAATPGLVEGGHTFYSVAGAEALRDVLPTFQKGHAIVGVTSTPFKCPPAPSECALMLHDYLVERGRRGDTEISVVIPFGTPIPPSPASSAAVLAAFAQREIRFVNDRLVAALDPARRVAVLDDGGRAAVRPVPRRAPAPRPQRGSGVGADRGRVGTGGPADTGDPLPRRLRGRGREQRRDPEGWGVRGGGGPRRSGRDHRPAARRAEPAPYGGAGSCYLEFGRGHVGRVDVIFLHGPPAGSFQPPSVELMAEKAEFGSGRVRRWFGREWTTRN